MSTRCDTTEQYEGQQRQAKTKTQDVRERSAGIEPIRKRSDAHAEALSLGERSKKLGAAIAEILHGWFHG
jgi:hypothetical protein